MKIIRNVHIPDSSQLMELWIEGEKIHSIRPLSPPPEGVEVFEGEENLYLPALVESHIHLDKALLGHRAVNESGTLQEAIEITAKIKPELTKEDIRSRALSAMGRMVEYGTGYARAHTEFDPAQGFTALEALLELREECQDWLTLQLVAFPQEGILKAPGTLEMMEEAVRMGVDAVGGIPYNDLNPQEHIDKVLALAMKYDLPLDLHQDFSDDCEGQSIDYLCDRVLAEGYEGRVSVGHVTSLDAMEGKALEKLIEKMARAKISVISLPMTDLHLGGRKDPSKVRRALTPIRKLRDGGVCVCLSTNNIQNPFTPFGNGDLLLTATVGMIAGHMGGAKDRESLLSMITENPARVLHLSHYGIKPGCYADGTLLACHRTEEVFTELPFRRAVFHKGRVVFEKKWENFRYFETNKKKQ